jgi:hypothetical protein
VGVLEPHVDGVGLLVGRELGELGVDYLPELEGTQYTKLSKVSGNPDLRPSRACSFWM